MKRFSIAYAVAAIGFAIGVWCGVTLPAGAQKEQSQSEKDALTVAQVLDVTAGLIQLSSYDMTDKDGKPTKGYYKFSADLRMLIALNIELGRRTQTTFQNAMNEVVSQLSNGAGKVPDEKQGLFTLEMNKLMSAQSRVGFHHIKKDDLKLEENPIPALTLSLILPIVDR